LNWFHAARYDTPFSLAHTLSFTQGVSHETARCYTFPRAVAYPSTDDSMSCPVTLHTDPQTAGDRARTATADPGDTIGYIGEALDQAQSSGS
jgi:hypothetical protein